jgi:hypothetical protein
MKIRVNIQCDLQDLSRVVIEKRVITTAESVLAMIQLALYGDGDVAHTVGSLAQHITALRVLPPTLLAEMSMEIVLSFIQRALIIKWQRHHPHTVWSSYTTEWQRFCEIPSGSLWETVFGARGQHHRCLG